MITKRDEQAATLRGSLLTFTSVFFEYMTGRPFIIGNPEGRESHHVIICRELTSLVVNPPANFGVGLHVPPGYGKSTLVSMLIPWAYTHFDDCNFMYVSYSHDLAAKHTFFAKQVMSTDLYKYLFNVRIRHDSRAKDNFLTTAGGEVSALGSAGTITGVNAGLPGLDRFSGALIIDDPIKPDAGHSNTIRERVINNYEETLAQRPRGSKVPIIFIGQRIHEEDLAGYLYNSGKSVRDWKEVLLPGLDSAGNALYPEVQSKEYLLDMQEKQPYVFASQIQQNPIPAGGALFKEKDFVILDEEPEILASFIVGDTAETDKSYNDSTVFSFFGIYEIETFGRKTGAYGLHWIDCIEDRVEPKDLQDLFLDFYADCNRHPCQPSSAHIEKKSTGTTLVSVMSDLRGLNVRDIKRSAASGSKTSRFLNLQPYVASKLISFTKGAKHIEMCLNHMSKITANDSHRFDDIADTLADGVRLALVEKTIYNSDKDDSATDVVTSLGQSFTRKQGALRHARGSKNIFR